MNGREREILEEFKRIKEACTRAPGPSGDDVPEWAKDGVESLPEFFNGAAHLWDAKFRDDYSDLHAATAARIPQTNTPITIIDVGCGTGLEFEYIFKRAPNARITGLDQAPRMLEQVRQKYYDFKNQITLIESSCLDWPDSLSDFDFVISILTVHHFPPNGKLGIYRNIRSALKASGTYIEGDQAASPEQEASNLDGFNSWISKLPGGSQAAWNYDVTLTVETNVRLLREAGFISFDSKWVNGDDQDNGHAVIVAQ